VSIPIQVIAYLLAALGLLVVVLTRVRLRRENAAGRAQTPASVLNLHTLFGLVGLATWTTYLVAPEESTLGAPVVGLAGLACLWIVVVCGLLILMRWLPTHGRHVGDRPSDSWSDGPGLSILAHVGMLVGVAVDTVAYALGVI
jgi:amino acid transporter